MRNPENVLISLTKHSNQKDYKYERLYRLLYNEELYLTAYQNIYSNDGSMTKGTDKQTVDGMSIERIRKIIVSLKDESYQPKPARRTYIPKKNGKMRPLGIPSFEDKLLQEVIRMILEAIYEGHFENTSHGFRPNRSCHTALNEIQKTFTGVKWFIEGDIKGFFDNINHTPLWIAYPYCYSGYLVSCSLHDFTAETSDAAFSFSVFPFLPCAIVVFGLFFALAVTQFGKKEMR